MNNKKFLSTTEAARLLGISRIAVFKKIKNGKIKAKKVGRNFVILRKDLPQAFAAVVSVEQKVLIDRVVKRAVREYGETFRLLGQE